MHQGECTCTSLLFSKFSPDAYICVCVGMRPAMTKIIKIELWRERQGI